MCLGGDVRNMILAESNLFCKMLRDYLQPDDQCVKGFDFVKQPAVIKRAYDNLEGFTRAFNLNLQDRINHELKGD